MFRTADRVYLITDGVVVTRGTPHELVNDEIAIKAYLGRSFEEDGFTRHLVTRVGVFGDRGTHAPVPPVAALAEPDADADVIPFAASPALGGVAGSILEQERLRVAVEQLADDRAVKAAMLELTSRGVGAVPVLLEALERREPILRRRAFELLKYLAADAGPLDYSPDAPDDIRLRQVAYLRAKFERMR